MRRSLYNEYGKSLEIAVDHFFKPPHMHDLTPSCLGFGSFVTVRLTSQIESYNKGIEIIKSYLREQGITELECYPPYIEIALNPELYLEKIKTISLEENAK